MERGRNATFTVLAGVLILLVVLAALLLIMLAPRSHPNAAQPQVGQLVASPCPAGTHAPVCYKAIVTNIGPGPGGITCQVAPAPDTTAVFGNNQTIYTTPAESPLQMNESITLEVITKPIAGDKTVTGSPTLGCTGV